MLRSLISPPRKPPHRRQTPKVKAAVLGARPTTLSRPAVTIPPVRDNRRLSDVDSLSLNSTRSVGRGFTTLVPSLIAE
ncbi:hypothetical protein BDM02DRAFT_1709332 [Thelephora ganbajun]|uniref:Uncharacterized protein n=1 Tax=Thelephora ganbajun TaxID=370292 RepID=A0ACB6Z0T8_THEGA|nr:hypothetical protein BDM02DRAFT_1709332 [Thelephora ganbajun]